jgi:hypothetical protein
MKRKTIDLKLTARDLALVCCFAPLCTILSFWSLFPIIGPVGAFINAATVVAPLIGLILGPYLGAFAVILGGAVGASLAQTGPFGPFSFVPWAATALCSGLLLNRKWKICGVLYAALLLVSTFYPVVGPAWLHPYFVWFQLIGLAVLVSPLQSKARRFLEKRTSIQEVFFGVSVTCFTAASFGQVAGSLMYETIYQPILISDLSVWKGSLQALTFIYPVERVIITVIATFLGVPLIKALRTSGFKIGGSQ